MGIAKKNKKGSAIAYGLVILAAISILFTSVVQFISSQVRYASYVETKEKTFHIAESGIYFYRWYLAHEIEGKNQQEIIEFWEGSPLGLDDTYTKDYYDNSDNKIGEIDIDVSFPTPGDYNVVEVTSEGWTLAKPEITREIKVRMRRSIWSDFVVLSDAILCMDRYWDVNGKIMGNEGVHFNGTVDNIVMAGVASYDDTNPLHTAYYDKPGVWTGMADPSLVFTAGTSYPVAKKDFSGVTAHLEAIRDEAQEPGGTTINDCGTGGCYFDDSEEGRHIILKSGGTFDICPVDQYWTNNGNKHHYPKKYKKISGSGTCNDCGGDCLENFNIPDEGAIFVEDNIWLEGTINDKRLAIAAASISDPVNDANIFVMDHIKYTNFNGDDVMGILAEGDIEILKNTPNDLQIDGALLAQNGAVTKPEYNPNCCGGGCAENKNYLDIFGCVITRGGLDFGFHKESCPNLDMDRTIDYDNNLYLYPPPFFPADSFYYVDFWEEV